MHHHPQDPRHGPRVVGVSLWARYPYSVGCQLGNLATAGINVEGLDETYLTARVYEVVLQKPIPAQIRQLIVYMSNNGG